MCNPALAVAAASAVASAVGTGMQMRSQNKQAQAQADAAAEAAQLDYQQLLQQQLDIGEEASRQALNRQIQTERYRSRIRAIQGDVGISGQSPLNILNQALIQESYDLGAMDYNRRSQLGQTRAASESIHANLRGRVNQAKSSTYSGFQSGLSIGTSAVGGFSSGYQLGDQLSRAIPKRTKKDA